MTKAILTKTSLENMFVLFELFRDFSNSFNSYIVHVDELSRNQTDRNHVQVKNKNDKIHRCALTFPRKP